MELFFPVWDLYTWQEVVVVVLLLLLVVVAVVKVGICGARGQMKPRWISLWNWSTDIDGLPEVIILEVKSPWECLCLKILEQILFTWVFLTALVLRLSIRLCRACDWRIFRSTRVYPLSKAQIAGWSTWQHVMTVTMQLLLTTLGPTVDVGISVYTYCWRWMKDADSLSLSFLVDKGETWWNYMLFNSETPIQRLKRRIAVVEPSTLVFDDTAKRGSLDRLLPCRSLYTWT